MTKIDDIVKMIITAFSQAELRTFLEAHDDGTLDMAIHADRGLSAIDADYTPLEEIVAKGIEAKETGVDIGTGDELSITRRIRHTFYPPTYSLDSVTKAVHRRYGNLARVVKYGDGKVEVDAVVNR